MEHEYNGMAEARQLQQYMGGGGRSFFPAEFMVGPPGHHAHLPYGNVMYRHDGAGMMGPVGGGMEAEVGVAGVDAGNGRWPRLETLSLLEVRTRLDSKFREANHQKAPLWDEVSRIMSEEYGYQRSGKKCREKFENLYKYYKKTKEGKSRRQDGKHYRFFRQLEALYGESSKSVSEADAHFHGGVGNGNSFRYTFPNDDVNNPPEPYPKFSDPSNCCDSVESSSGGSGSSEDQKGKKRRGKTGLKGKIMGFINDQMTKLMEKQEAWMEKVMSTIEAKEKERMLREEKWRKQDAARIEREHSFWAGEKAWIEARDNALMEAFHQAAAKGIPVPGKATGNWNANWTEYEISRLIQLRSGMKFGGEIPEEALWDEVARKMASLGHQRSGIMCKEKWESLNEYAAAKGSKKRKENENPKTSSCYENLGAVYCDGSEPGGIGLPMTIATHNHSHWGPGF